MAENKHFREPPTSYITYIIVFFIISAISVISFVISYLNWGSFGSFLILTLSSIQVTILALYFMYLRYEDKLTIGFSLMPLFFVLLLILGNIMDIHFSKEELIEYQKNANTLNNK
ncbi:MAG: cytochrome C oxidase subunit IV family protein [candidate division WOR-3 bacterium]